MNCAFSLTILLAITASACCSVDPTPELPYNLATIAYPRVEKNSLDRRWDAYASKQIEAAKEAEVIFLGDSITDFWSMKGANEVWNESFSDFKPANMGISSDGSQHLLYRLKMFHHKFPHAKPKCFFLMIGTNNLGYLKDTPAQGAAGTLAIVNFLTKTYPASKIIVSTLTPSREGNFGDKAAERIAELDKIVTDTLEKYNNDKIIRFNSTDVFLDEKGNQKQGLFTDKCHLTTEGYKVWASIIVPELNKQLKR